LRAHAPGETQYLLDGFERRPGEQHTERSIHHVNSHARCGSTAGRIGAGYAHSGANVLSLETPDGDDNWRFGTTNPVPGIIFKTACAWETGIRVLLFPSHRAADVYWFSDAISLQHTFTLVSRAARWTPTRPLSVAGDNLFRCSTTQPNTFCVPVFL